MSKIRELLEIINRQNMVPDDFRYFEYERKLLNKIHAVVPELRALLAERAGLRELVGKNRGPVDSSLNDFERGYRHGLNRFADELEAALANTEPAWRGLEIDPVTDTVTIEGIKFAGGLFEDLSKITPEGQALRVINTDNGVCTVQTVQLANTEPSVPVSQWQPIETAPKDGKPIFVLSKADSYEDGDGNIHERPARAYIAKWNPDGDSWVDEVGNPDGEICTLGITGTWDSGMGWFQPNEVTHWMPLPEPPQP